MEPRTGAVTRATSQTSTGFFGRSRTTPVSRMCNCPTRHSSRPACLRFASGRAQLGCCRGMSEPWAYPLGLAGNALALWAIAALGIAPTSGDESMLVYRGPYRFSRNPQYVGFIAALIGWALLTNSVLALIVSLAGITPLLLVPLAEEPWLRERLGAAYADYQHTVPRFIGMKK